MLNMSDEKGQDEKLLAVPTEDPRFKDVHSLEDMPQHVLDEIAHFFKVYKDLENKRTDIGDWEGPEKAAQVVDECFKRYQEQ
jgi:inorganic pyrophosphatase